MVPATVVIIATKGRPEELSNLLELLALQTSRPDAIIISATDDTDVDQSRVSWPGVLVVYGPSGLTAQRNRALSIVRGKYDIVIFFDDDFVPSRFWIEHVKAFLSAHPDAVGVTGKILRDGVKLSEGLKLAESRSLVDKADASWTGDFGSCTVKRQLPYGCNMAFRARSIEHLAFDERLVLYGWLEDRDFGLRVGSRARLIMTDCLWGVHLGTKRARVSGVRYGYSQTVNPWYLMRKGTMGPLDACRYIARGFLRNGLGSVFQTSSIDRRGRFWGNLVGIKDIIFGHWAPERVIEL
jgi:glycosyl transferase family 2